MRVIIPAVIILFFLPDVLKAQSISFSAAADNTIYQENPLFSNGSGQNIFAGNTANSIPRRALIKFNINLSPPPPGTASTYVITSATLQLTMNRSIAIASNISLYKATSSWGEGASDAGGQEGRGTAAALNDATWSCRFFDGAAGCGQSWVTPGGDFNPVPSATTSVGPALGIYNWSSAQMVADVQDWVNSGGTTNLGWVIKGNEAAPTTANRFGSRENPTAADRPVLNISYNILPVKLSLFNAVETKNGNLLSWHTEQEIDNAFFSVEHSTDGRNFSPIGRIAGSGTSSIARSYSFLHDGVSEGKHFYRLAQTDINGRVDHSAIVSVTNAKKINIIRVTPNPVTDMLSITNTLAPGSRYTIVNGVGASLTHGELTGNTLNVGQLPKGSYWILLQTKSGEVFKGRFLKQ